MEYEDVSDPADWVGEFKFMRGIDSSLRCEMCYDIFRAPVSLKECTHTFCSACIRSHINQAAGAGAFCPKCRQKKAFDSELVPQPVLEASANAWREARGHLIKKMDSFSVLLKDLEAARASAVALPSSSQTSQSNKRRRTNGALNEQSNTNEQISEAGPSNKPTRSSARLQTTSIRRSGDSKSDALEIDCDDDQVAAIKDDYNADSTYAPSQPGSSDPIRRSASPSRKKGRDARDYQKLTASDAVECPICSYKFTMTALNRHLDKGCEPGGREPSLEERGFPAATSDTGLIGTGRSPSKSKNGGGGGTGWFSRGGASVGPGRAAPDSKVTPSENEKKLGRLQYGLMSETQIRKALDAAHLPHTGTKERMIERHRQWVNLFNANLDANPKHRKNLGALRKELAEWDSGQDEAIRIKSKGGVVPESKAKTWLSDNKQQYENLIREARANMKKAVPSPAGGGVQAAGSSGAVLGDSHEKQLIDPTTPAVGPSST